MPFSIVILPNAHRQIVQAARWWREHGAKSPAWFADELDRALLRIAEQPHLGTSSPWPRLPDVRRILVRRIEYVVFYRPRPRAARIEVLAVWHARRGVSPQ